MKGCVLLEADSEMGFTSQDTSFFFFFFGRAAQLAVFLLPDQQSRTHAFGSESTEC